MIFRSSNPDIKTIIDYFRTGKYGEEEYPAKIYCSHCGATIVRNETFYKIKETNFCLGCSDVADGFILENYRDRFLYEL